MVASVVPITEAAAADPKPVLSVIATHRNADLIAEVARLWIRGDDLVVDATYGRGLFWERYRPARLVAHDIGLDGVDFRDLPEKDRTVDVVVLDAPYTSVGGRETSTLPDFNNRYGLKDAPKTPAGVDRLIGVGIAEACRVLHDRKSGRHVGLLMVKCADYVSGGHFHQGHRNAQNVAARLGMEQIDEFVHASGTGPQPAENLDGTKRRQVTSRRAHSFLCVFANTQWNPGDRWYQG